jgi:hypothetical protein
MKKIALAIASLALAATPVLACPHSDKAESETTAPRTAEKDKKDAPKAEKGKEADTAKKAEKPAEKKTEKKTDKVSQR